MLLVRDAVLLIYNTMKEAKKDWDNATPRDVFVPDSARYKKEEKSIYNDTLETNAERAKDAFVPDSWR